MFESVQVDESAARYRAASIPPAAAFVMTLIYISLYPLLPGVPAWLFWSVDGLLLAGSVWGGVRLVRAIRAAPPRGALAGWAAGAAGVNVICAWLFLSFTLPWI